MNTRTSLCLAALFLVMGCAEDFKSVTTPSGSSIAAVATANSDLNIFVAALTKTGLANTFSNNNSGAFTVFAPTDAAFIVYFNSLTAAQLPPGAAAPGTFDEAAVLAAINLVAVTYIPASGTAMTPSSLGAILLYHVINSKVTSSKVTGAQGFVTLTSTSARLSVSKVGTAIVLNANKTGNGAANGGQSVTVDVDASNGVIHTIDKVLIPVSTANIWTSTLLNFTVNYGVSPPAVTVYGTALKRNTVVAPAIGTINLEDATALAPTDATGTNYNLLSMAIARAELATVIIPIATPFPDYTVFAPTDAAFLTYLNVADEVAARTAINALAPIALADLIKYHIIAGRVVSTDLTAGQSLTTLLAGKSIKILSVGLPVTINDLNATVADPTPDATITSLNNLTNAGILHQINAVLKSN